VAQGLRKISLFLYRRSDALEKRRKHTANPSVQIRKAADLVEQAVHETLTYYGFPDTDSWNRVGTETA
jgi:hypothetical protein